MRKYIEKIKVYGDRFMVSFKAGVDIDILKIRNRLQRQAFGLVAFCHFRLILVEKLILFAVWYIIYEVTVGKEK